MKFVVSRPVTVQECFWLSDDIPEGTIVYHYTGPTYGCIGSGIAVSEQEGETPFFELPMNAVERV